VQQALIVTNHRGTESAEEERKEEREGRRVEFFAFVGGK
jgi:hypothetical protein